MFNLFHSAYITKQQLFSISSSIVLIVILYFIKFFEEFRTLKSKN